jgi:uncharacterized lipoprotein NlpE involved in copper resistance
MKMLKWVGWLIVLLLVLGVGFFVANGKGPGTTYEGTLPGADCAGLKTELTLYQNGSYFLRETYLATRDGDKTFTSAGKWKTVKAGKRDFIQLNYDKPQETYNFLHKDAEQLVVVDKQLKMIDCPQNLTLARKK